ncbi:MAG: 2-oxoacid:acceptor oxidoreductase family protein, partial [Promethearchaeia archaeon]
MTEEENIQIVIHGRGGQGCVTACEIIAESAYLSGNFVDVHAYPSFGAERRGAPVQAYAKLSQNEQIWDRSEIKHPDILI